MTATDIRQHSLRWFQRALIWPVVAPIRVYQFFVSPIMPNICRFHPSCSVYAREALETRGLWMGLVLGSWRICRCNPFSQGGFDPVPPPRQDED